MIKNIFCIFIFSFLVQAGETSEVQWVELLSHQEDVLNDSEISVSLPQESGKGITSVTISAENKKNLKAWGHSRKGALKQANLQESQYLELVSELKKINFQELRKLSTDHCEFLVFKLKIGQAEEKFRYCRSASDASAIISRFVHYTEYLLFHNF